MYKIQYTHNQVKWFDFGADATKTATTFNTIDEAAKQFDHIINRYFGLFSVSRIVDLETNEIVKTQSPINQVSMPPYT